MPTQTIIKYGETDITWEFQSGRWQHPITGIQYTTGWNPLDVEGLTVEEVELPEPPEPEPQIEYIPTLTPRQVRLVLNQAGLRSAVETAVVQADQDTKDWWEFSLEYVYDNPILVNMANSLGITEEQRKQIFITGSTL